MSTSRKLTNEQVAQARAMLDSGYSMAAVGSRFGVTRQTISKHTRKVWRIPVEDLDTIVKGELRAQKITRRTCVPVRIQTVPTGAVVWADGERIGPFPIRELDDILDGVELSAWCIADAREDSAA